LRGEKGLFYDSEGKKRGEGEEGGDANLYLLGSYCHAERKEGGRTVSLNGSRKRREGERGPVV